MGFIVLKPGLFALASTYIYNYRFLFPIGFMPDEWFLGHLWSLSMEEQFYLLWPLLIAVFALTKLTRIVPVLLVLFPLMRFVNYFFFPEARGIMQYMIHTAGDSLLYGCYGALLIWHHPDYIKKILAVTERYKLHLFEAFYLFIVSPLLHEWIPAKAGFITLTLDPLCIILLMLWLLHSGGKLWWFFNNQYIVQLGIYSYSLYIWQQLFLTTNNTGISGMFPLNIVCAGILAWLSYNLVEKQFLKLKKYL